MASGKKISCIVTGGAGFLGDHLVRQLIDSGRYDVTVFDIRECGIEGARNIIGDLTKPEDVNKAVEGVEVVFHCATAAPSGENALMKGLMHSVNVTGTEYLIKACVDKGVKRMVYTSSASVVFEGKNLMDVNETIPYASKPLDYYTQTKIEGEKLVLAANGRGGLSTCALRPSGIFGENDPIFVPTTVKQAKKGVLRCTIGNGKNLMDWTYVGNVAQAHLQAADALVSNPKARGQAFFITNAEPTLFWGFMGDVLEDLGYPRPTIPVPLFLWYLVAFILSYIVKPIFDLLGKKLSVDFTINRVKIASTHRVFNCQKAKQELGYRPRVSLAEARQLTVASFEHLRNAKAKTG